jgi:AraC family transcriptional regulator, regulatory protein of adaptative response / methylated-DNA-[protein]-cysteine methyltransferase
MSSARAWNAVLEHDRRFDGTFVYAVTSTGVYCRPSCPSRRPHRRHVRFFASPELAEASGFRGCRRCEPQSAYRSRSERMVEQVRRHLDAHLEEPATLNRLAELAGMSPFHLQRAFSRQIGLSPKAYRSATRLDTFLEALRRGSSVTTAAFEAGFGSSSRAAEQASRYLGMTPSALRSGGAGLTLDYVTMRTPVGLALIAATKRGVASVTLGDRTSVLLARLRREFPRAHLRRGRNRLEDYKQALVRCMNGMPLTDDVLLDLRSSAFHVKVWKALQRIPAGSTRTYQDIARAIGQPAASRAVAKACASNPLALLVPCHRVVRKDGRLAGYRWGLHRKDALLRLEAKRATRDRRL